MLRVLTLISKQIDIFIFNITFQFTYYIHNILAELLEINLLLVQSLLGTRWAGLQEILFCLVR